MYIFVHTQCKYPRMQRAFIARAWRAYATQGALNNQQRSVLGFSIERTGLGVVGLLLWTSHLPKYQIQPWSHVKRPGWWLGTAIPMFPWGLNCHQLHPPPLGPPDRLRSRPNIFRLWAPTKDSNIPLDAPLREDPESDEKPTNFQHIKYEIL